MSKYFESTSPQGNVLIDDETARMVLRRVIRLSSAYASVNYNHVFSSSWQYTFYTVDMLDGEQVCFATSSDSSRPITCFNSGGKHCVSIFYTDSPYPENVTLYIFGTPQQVDPHCGLLIKNASGHIIFSSEQQLMYKIKALWSTRRTWGNAVDYPTGNIDTGIYSYQTAINGSSYIGQGISYLGQINGYRKYFSMVYAILFSNTLTLKSVPIYDGYNFVSGAATWDWGRCAPVGVGCSLTAIDISRYPTSL